jgi:hypothetical protein
MKEVKKTTFIEDLELVRTEMKSIGKDASTIAKLTGDTQKIRNANMSFRCMMQAIRDEVRFHVIVKKISQ